MKEVKSYIKIILMAFSKNSFEENWAILGPKMTHGCNSGSTLSIFFNFAQSKRPEGTS